MDLHYLELFYALATEQSYTRAANSLYISQPALSAQIKKFEAELGVKLFDKIGHKVFLNENGKLLFEHAKRIFTIVEEAENQILSQKDSISGSISIGGSNTAGIYILPKIIREFKILYPHVNLDLHIFNTNEIANLVSEGKIDFAVNGGSLKYGSNVFVEKLMEERVVLSASPASELALKKFIQPEDLMDTDFIAHVTNSQLYKLAENITEELGIPSKITMTFGSIDAIKQAVAANLGISPIPLSAVSLELCLGFIKELKIQGKEWSYPYSLIYNKNKYLSPAAKKLIDMIRNKLLARPE